MADLPCYIPLPGRALLAVRGADAATFLQGLVSCDVRRAGVGRALLGALLTPQGKFLFDFFLVGAEDGFLLDAEASRVDELLKKLRMYRLRAAVEIERLEGWVVTAVLGQAAPGAVKESVVVADPRHPAMGWRIYSPVTTIPADVSTGTFEEYEKRRISLGLPDGSRDAVVEKTLLLENGYDKMGGVDFAKGCYVGQEVTARTKHRGELKKYLFIVKSTAPLPETGAEIQAEGRAAGELRSSIGVLGLALLRTDMLGGLLSVGGQPLQVITPWWHAAERE